MEFVIRNENGKFLSGSYNWVDLKNAHVDNSIQFLQEIIKGKKYTNAVVIQKCMCILKDVDYWEIP